MIILLLIGALFPLSSCSYWRYLFIHNSSHNTYTIVLTYRENGFNYHGCKTIDEYIKIIFAVSKNESDDDKFVWKPFTNVSINHNKNEISFSIGRLETIRIGTFLNTIGNGDFPVFNQVKVLSSSGEILLTAKSNLIKSLFIEERWSNNLTFNISD
jgi:hypothetical protein